MADPLRLFEDRIETPIGELALIADADAFLRAVHWTGREALLLGRLSRQYGELTIERDRAAPELRRAIVGYFAGDLGAIDDLPVRTEGTPFQRAVWAALRTIPCGTTVSYGHIARQIGRPAAVRAVGLANNANPIGVVVPCHRVVGSNGALTGYGGGIERKRWLLEHEGAVESEPLFRRRRRATSE